LAIAKSKEKGQAIQWPSQKKKDRQYNGQVKRKSTGNTMARSKEKACIVCSSFVFIIVLSVLLLFFLLYCLFFFCFDHCIVCSSFVLIIVLSVLLERRTDNTMIKTKEEQTIQ
jgi:hypothetical protein